MHYVFRIFTSCFPVFPASHDASLNPADASQIVKCEPSIHTLTCCVIFPSFSCEKLIFVLTSCHHGCLPVTWFFYIFDFCACQLPLWVCPDCRKKVEEDEEKGGFESNVHSVVRSFCHVSSFKIPSLQRGWLNEGFSYAGQRWKNTVMGKQYQLICVRGIQKRSLQL